MKGSSLSNLYVTLYGIVVEVHLVSVRRDHPNFENVPKHLQEKKRQEILLNSIKNEPFLLIKDSQSVSRYVFDIFIFARIINIFENL